MKRVECRYCDTCTGPRNFNGDQVCNGCGAEWAGAKIEVRISEEQLAWEQNEADEAQREWEEHQEELEYEEWLAEQEAEEEYYSDYLE